MDAMYILDCAGDERIARLRDLESFFDGRQFDHLGADWWGDTIRVEQSYLHHRRHWAAKPQAKMKPRPLAAVARRPCVQVGMPAQIRMVFTNEVLPKMPPVEVVADEEATECLSALLVEADGGEAFSQLRNLGAVGSAAIVVDVVDGKPCLTPRRSSELTVLEWASMERWEPADVVYQRRETVYKHDGGRVKPVTIVRTTRYTQTEVIEYEDVEEREHPKDKPIAEAERREHHAGRCPVVWYQNTRNADAPDGRHDLETEANLELSDRADGVFSHIVMAAQANAEPTVWKADRVDAAHIFGKVVQKGNGRLISLSESGKVGYLETSGSSVQVGLDVLATIIRTIQKGASCLVPDIEIGGMKTATEIERLWTAMDAKVRKLRSSMERAIVQVGDILLTMARVLGVSSKDAPQPETTIVLPPKVVEVEVDGDDDDETRTVSTVYSPGVGRTVQVRWPSTRQVQPRDLPGLLNGLGLATKGQQVMSRETAVSEAMSAIGRTDVADELRRIEDEEHERAEEFEPMPLGANELAESAAAASEPGDEEEGNPDGPAEDELEETPDETAGDSRERM